MTTKKTLAQVTEKIHRLALIHGFPYYAQFEVTSRCNLRCSMCYIANKAADTDIESAELTAQELLDLARQARDMGVMVLNVTGGEALIKKDFWHFYDGLCQLGLIVSLNTNGTTITQDIAQRLAKTPPSRILVSIYGASEKTYKKVTGSAKAFHLARRGVENLLNAGISIIIRTTLIKDNVDDYPLIKDWAKSLGQELYIVDYVSPRREGAGTAPVEVRMTLEQITGVYEMLRRDADEKRLNAKNELLQKDELDLLQQDALPEEESMSEEEREKTKDPRAAFKCSAARTAFLLAHDGRMLPCGLLNEPVAYPLQVGLATAWEQLKKATYDIPACGVCQDCVHEKRCAYCPAKLKLETGSFNGKKPEYLCTTTEIANRVFVEK